RRRVVSAVRTLLAARGLDHCSVAATVAAVIAVSPARDRVRSAVCPVQGRAVPAGAAARVPRPSVGADPVDDRARRVLATVRTRRAIPMISARESLALLRDGNLRF